MAKTKIDPEDRRYGKPFVPNIADDQPTRRDLYMGTLVNRILEIAEKRRKYDITRYNYANRFSWKNLSRATGIPYWTIVHYFIRRDRPLDIPTLDKVLWAMKLSVLDLLQPLEIMSYLQSLDSEELMGLRTAVQKRLDRLKAAEYSTTSTGSSQIAPEPAENNQV